MTEDFTKQRNQIETEKDRINKEIIKKQLELEDEILTCTS